MIRKFVRKNHAVWASHLPLFEFAYNSAVHTITEMAPFVAELARMPLIPVSMLLPEKDVPPPPRSIREYVQGIHAQLREIRKEVCAQDERVADSQNLIPSGADDD